MTRFWYQAEQEAGGQRVAGEIEAADADAARQRLHEMGLREIQLGAEPPRAATSLEAGQAKPIRLGVEDAHEMLSQVAAVGRAELPLSGGLRAAAAASPKRRVQAALNSLADQLDQGQSLESALSSQTQGMPRYLAGLVEAAVRTRRLGLALEDLVHFQRTMHRMRWNLLISLLYPALVLGLAIALIVVLLYVVVPPFRMMFEDFNLDLPEATILIVKLSDAAIFIVAGIRKWLTLGVLLGLVLALLAIRYAVGVPLWRRILGTIPLVGPLWAWSGAAAFTQLLAVLLEEELPLSEALQLTAQGLEDPNVRDAAGRYAAAIEQGSSLSLCLRQGRQLPETLHPFVAWGEQSGKLAEGLRTANHFYFERLRLRARLVRSISPPVIFVFVAMLIGVSIIGLVLPLFELLVGLS